MCYYMQEFSLFDFKFAVAVIDVIKQELSLLYISLQLLF